MQVHDQGGQGEGLREPTSEDKRLPWFRMYHEAIDDEKLRLLAFEDRWHFVALLCCKAQGILDSGDALMLRKVAVKLGITLATLEEVVRRLAEVGLIDANTLDPLKWDARQYRSDSSTSRTRAFRERMKQSAQRSGNASGTFPERSGDGVGTAQETDTDTDTEAEKDKHAPPDGGGAPPDGDAGVSKDAVLDARFLKAQGVGAQHAKDWLAARRKKRLPLTLTAWEATCEEAQKAGITPAEAVALSAREGWAGFKASWVHRAGGAGAAVVSNGASGHALNRAEQRHENNKRAGAEGVRLIQEREARRRGTPPADGNTIDMPE